MLQSTEITFATAWKPFQTSLRGHPIRALSSPEGVADRLRVVAFAELQARDAFLWGAARFAQEGVAVKWCEAWAAFAAVENRHAQMLLTRMDELKVNPGERVVSDRLTRVCHLAKDPVNFLFYLSSAEERGMEAGFFLGKEMRKYD